MLVDINSIHDNTSFFFMLLQDLHLYCCEMKVISLITSYV